MLALYRQTIGRLLPINTDRSPVSHDPREDQFNVSNWTCYYPDPSCPVMTYSTTDRTEFGPGGCVVYGYPSTGGVLQKHATVLDMLYLSLSRSHVSYRSPDPDEEDRFCNLLRRTGAKWWPSKGHYFETRAGMRETTTEQEKLVVFGWPTDGVGVWVLRFANENRIPRDYVRVCLAITMEEKIEVMREYGATFVEDITTVEELNP